MTTCHLHPSTSIYHVLTSSDLRRLVTEAVAPWIPGVPQEHPAHTVVEVQPGLVVDDGGRCSGWCLLPFDEDSTRKNTKFAKIPGNRRFNIPELWLNLSKKHCSDLLWSKVCVWFVVWKRTLRDVCIVFIVYIVYIYIVIYYAMLWQYAKHVFFVNTHARGQMLNPVRWPQAWILGILFDHF